MSRATRLFLILSLVLLATDLAFIGINYRSSRTQFDTSMHEQAKQQRFAYQLALEMELDNLVKMAYLIAADPHVNQLFLKGKKAVTAEGGGAGGDKAVLYRTQLMGQVAAVWPEMRDHFAMRQLHFHIGPGSLSFLRAHKPEKYGDRMDDLRHIIVDTNRDAQWRTGFETGRVYSGLRGVVPVFARDDDIGEQVQVGAVEVGASFDHLFELIDRQLDSGVAALLQRSHVQEKMWPEQIRATFEVMTDRCDCAVDSYSRMEVADLLAEQGRLPPFNGAPYLLSYVSLGKRLLAITHLPLQDYVAVRDGSDELVGRIVLWRDVTAEKALFRHNVWTSVFYAVFGYLVVEILLFWAIRLVTGRMQSEIDRQTGELVRLKDQAEAASSAKTAFLANVSHELRTPLNAVLGYAQVLQRDLAGTGPGRRAVEAIKRNGDYLVTLINDVLDLAKIEAGRFEVFPGPCNTRKFFRDIAELFEIRARDKGIEFRCVSGDDLPALVEVDERRLRQILMNLLANAVKFTERGLVELKARYADCSLRIEVRDTGVGISVDRLETLLQPFEQEGAAEYRRQGTGLGLAISKSLIDQMAGTLEVESQVGQGSCFIVGIPARIIEQRRTTRQQRISYDRVVGYRRGDGEPAPYRILIVDDVEENSDVLRAMLEPLGFEIEQADSGVSGVEKAMSTCPDLVLMDLVMPDIDGLEAARRIRTESVLSATKVVACSARAFAEDREKSRAAGCVDHIVKPVQMARLLDVLGRHLQLRWIEGADTQSASG